MKSRNIISYMLIALGVVMITIGIYRGEPYEVLTKAVRICLECIGIG